jgi:hypothetical protein
MAAASLASKLGQEARRNIREYFAAASVDANMPCGSGASAGTGAGPRSAVELGESTSTSVVSLAVGAPGRSTGSSVGWTHEFLRDVARLPGLLLDLGRTIGSEMGRSPAENPTPRNTGCTSAFSAASGSTLAMSTSSDSTDSAGGWSRSELSALSCNNDRRRTVFGVLTLARRLRGASTLCFGEVGGVGTSMVDMEESEIEMTGSGGVERQVESSVRRSDPVADG